MITPKTTFDVLLNPDEDGYTHVGTAYAQEDGTIELRFNEQFAASWLGRFELVPVYTGK